MNTNTNTPKTAERPDFEQVKRNYETALASGKDSTQELTALATAVAYSVLNKCIDPQRKTAADRETVSDNGYNPALVQLKRGIAANRLRMFLHAHLDALAQQIDLGDGTAPVRRVDK